MAPPPFPPRRGTAPPRDNVESTEAYDAREGPRAGPLGRARGASRASRGRAGWRHAGPLTAADRRAGAVLGRRALGAQRGMAVGPTGHPPPRPDWVPAGAFVIWTG